MKCNGERLWLYSVVDSETGDIFYVRLFPTRTIVVTKAFRRELIVKHHVDDTEFIVDGT